MRISNTLLEPNTGFLENRSQRAVLNGQTSDWLPVKRGVPQGSILGPLFFLIYINDLSNDIVFTVKLFEMIHHYVPLFMMLRLPQQIK